MSPTSVVPMARCRFDPTKVGPLALTGVMRTMADAYFSSGTLL